MKNVFLVLIIVVALFIGLLIKNAPTITKEYNFENQELRITTILYQDREDLKEAHPDNIYSSGFATLYPEDKECEIHALEGTDIEKTLGHELMHCLYGRWHK